jgi:hypothetical protein
MSLRQRPKTESDTPTSEVASTGPKPTDHGPSWFGKMVTRSIVGTGMMLFFYLIIVTKPFIIIPCFVFVLQIVTFYELINVRYSEAKEKRLILFRTQCWYVFVFSLSLDHKEVY